MVLDQIAQIGSRPGVMHQQERNEGAAQIGRHFSYRYRVFLACVLAVLCTVFTSFAGRAPEEKPGPVQPANKIRILLLTDTSKLLTVHYLTKGRAIRDLLMTAPIGGVGTMAIDMAETKHESTKESRILQATVGEFNRRPMIEAGIVASFKDKTVYFDVVTPPDPSVYMTETNINFSKAQADGFPYVLWVKEKYAGESTPFGALGTLSAGSALEFKVYDAATGKDMGKAGRVSSTSQHKQEFGPATSDRNAFVDDYGVAASGECAQVYGVLSKQGHLHAMAVAHGFGDEVPDLGAILAKYEKRFDYEFKLAKGWHHFKSTTKYQAILERFRDGTNFNVVVKVDLMLPELGQKPGDLNEYIRLYFEHLQEEGYETDTAKPFNGLHLDPACTAFLLDRQQGIGKEILVFRRFDDPFVVVYDVVFVQDYDGYMAKYSADLQTMINESRIKIRQ